MRTAPFTRNVTVPPSTTSGIVSTPVIARTSTPAGTGTSKVLVFWAAVDIVPGTGVESARAAPGTTRAAVCSTASAPATAHAPERRRPCSRVPRTTTSRTAAVVTSDHVTL